MTKLPKLPEPSAHQLYPPDIPLFNGDQLRAYGAECRRQALEESAVVCEAQENRVVASHPARVEFDPDSVMARKCAAAIRGMMK